MFHFLYFQYHFLLSTVCSIFFILYTTFVPQVQYIRYFLHFLYYFRPTNTAYPFSLLSPISLTCICFCDINFSLFASSFSLKRSRRPPAAKVMSGRRDILKGEIPCQLHPLKSYPFSSEQIVYFIGGETPTGIGKGEWRRATRTSGVCVGGGVGIFRHDFVEM